MEFNVLGPLEVVVGARELPHPSPKVSQLLSLLLLNDGRFVPSASLSYELWPDDAPRTALTTLQTYVVQLRKLLAGGTRRSTAEIAKDVLQTRGTGYRLNVDAGALDLHGYRRLLAEAEAGLRAGDHDTAMRSWRRAESVWRGDVLVDIEHGPLLSAAAAELRESRLTMTSRRIEAQLTLGLHYQTLGELAGLVQFHPIDEGLHTQFMLALHRSGHRGRALQVYHELRRSMRDRLGVGPSASTQRVFQALLSGDESLDLVR